VARASRRSLAPPQEPAERGAELRNVNDVVDGRAT
jgi:hypothetical protein